MIGLFDSGFGGLTILKAFLEELPEFDYIYFGDNARTPYGNKSLKIVYEYTRQAVAFLFRQGATLIILACNTASAKALRRIQQEWLPTHYPERRVLGVAIPLAEAAVVASRRNRIGIIGTRATIESKVYEQELHKLNPALKVFARPCPLLVPLVEEGWVGKPETNMILKKYLRPLKSTAIDTLTDHSMFMVQDRKKLRPGFLKKDITRIMGKNCHVLDAPGIISEKLADYLKRHPEIEKKLSRKGRRVFYTSDDSNRFKAFGETFLGRHIAEVRTVFF